MFAAVVLAELFSKPRLCLWLVAVGLAGCLWGPCALADSGSGGRGGFAGRRLYKSLVSEAKPLGAPVYLEGLTR